MGLIFISITAMWVGRLGKVGQYFFILQTRNRLGSGSGFANMTSAASRTHSSVLPDDGERRVEVF